MFFLRRILLQFTSVCLWLVLFNYKLSDVIGGYVMGVLGGKPRGRFRVAMEASSKKFR